MKSAYFVSKKKEKGGEATPQYEGQYLESFNNLVIDGQDDLSQIITFNDGGCVHGISLTGSPGIYDYVLNIDAQGPKGAFSGSGHLKFHDESGDCYKIFIYSSTRSVHTLRYNSKKPNIIKVEWYY